MFIDKAAAIVAMVFAAVILAHPGPAIAQADVDKAMGVLPSPPGASKGIIIIDGKQMSPAEAQKMGVDASDAESKGIIIINGKPMSLSDAAAKGIIIVEIKPGGLPSPGASKGIIIIGIKPGGDAATKGIIIGNKPGGIAAKGASPPNSLGGAPGMRPASKMPPSILPAGKALQGLKGPPAEHKAMPYRALQK